MSTEERTEIRKDMNHNKGLISHSLIFKNSKSVETKPFKVKISDESLKENSKSDFIWEQLRFLSLEKLVQYKLELFFKQQKEACVQIDGLYDLILEQIEKPLIELSLKQLNGHQVNTAKMLGINRNTLKRKMNLYKLKNQKYKKKKDTASNKT